MPNKSARDKLYCFRCAHFRALGSSHRLRFKRKKCMRKWSDWTLYWVKTKQKTKNSTKPTKQQQCDQLFRSPVKETIELDTKFVCTHARVICVTRQTHTEFEQKQTKQQILFRVFFPNDYVERDLSCSAGSKTCNRYSGLLACRFCRVFFLSLSPFHSRLLFNRLFFFHVFFCLAGDSPFGLYNTIVSRQGTPSRERNEYDVSI